MEISIIIPSYKPGEYIFDCLASLKAQTMAYNCFEVILVLNGCKNPYETALKKYIRENMADMNIRFFQTDIASVSHARNMGLDEASGRYIGFIDDDDYVSPSYLQELYEIAQKGVIPLCNIIAFLDKNNQTCSYYLTDTYYKNKSKGIRSILQVRSYMSTSCCKLIPRKIIGSRRFCLKFKNGEDSLFMFLISDKTEKFLFTSENAVYYRRYRLGSAVTRKRSFVQRTENLCDLIVAYTSIYMKAPLQYHFLFYVTRVLASVRSIFASL